MANNVTDLGKVGMTPKGAYNSATTYERLDVVTYEGSSYVSLVDSNTNNNPSTATNKWQLMAAHGEFTEAQLEEFKAAVVAESKEEMDDYTDDKKAELDTYEDTKETELNTYTGTKKTELDTYTGGLKTDFNDNATSKTTTFNTNATNKTTDFNDNASSKTTSFNTNASDKTTAFDSHVEDKTDEFDEHTEEMQQEIDELSANMPWATPEQATEFNLTDAAKYSRNKLELFGNTSQVSYEGKNLLPSDASTQTLNDVIITKNNDGSYTLNGTASALTSVKIGDIQIENGKTYTMSSGNSDDSSNSYRIDGRKTVGSIYNNWTTASIPTLTATEDVTIGIYIRIANGYNCNNVKIYPQVELGSTATDYEQYVGGIPAPNPDYPQDIHVVTGNNTIKLNNANKNFFNVSNSSFSYGTLTFALSNNIINISIGEGSGGLSQAAQGEYTNYDFDTTKDYYFSVYRRNGDLAFNSEAQYQWFKVVIYIKYSDDSTSDNNIQITNGMTQASVKLTFTEGKTPVAFAIGRYSPSNTLQANQTAQYNVQLEEGSSATSYVPYVKTNYAVNLGNIELCKIGNYQDYLYKENGNWYKYGAIRKYTECISAAVQTSTYRCLLKHRDNLHDMSSTTNIQASGKSKYTQVSSNSSEVYRSMIRYNYGWVGLNIVYNVGIGNFSTGTDVKNWFDNNETIYMVINTTIDNADITQITDSTLISQLDAIYEHLQLVKGTNNITVTASDLAPYMELSYMQDLPSKLNNLDSRLALLE